MVGVCYKVVQGLSQTHSQLTNARCITIWSVRPDLCWKQAKPDFQVPFEGILPLGEILKRLASSYYCLMRENITVQLTTMARDKVSLEVHPRMTTGELTEFMLHSAVLHQLPQKSPSLRPVCLQATPRHLLLDYMLTARTFTVQELHDAILAVRGLDKSRRCQHAYYVSRRYGSIELDEEGGKRTVELRVCYREGDEYSSRKVTEQQYIEGYTTSSLQDQSEEVTGKYGVNLNRSIEFDCDPCEYVMNYSISKEAITSYEMLEKVLLLREKLISLSSSHTHIYGSLLKVTERKHDFVFIFTYQPSVPLTLLAKTQLTPRAHQALTQQVWTFISHLRSHNYESLITKLTQQHSIKSLLEKFQYDIHGRMSLVDPSLAYKEGSAHEMTRQQEKELLLQIRAFLTQTNLQQRNFDWHHMEGKAQPLTNVLSREGFIRLFKTESHTLSHKVLAPFDPIHPYFLWNKRSSQEKMVDGALVDACEMMTAKKKPNRAKDGSLNRTTKGKSISGTSNGRRRKKTTK